MSLEDEGITETSGSTKPPAFRNIPKDLHTVTSTVMRVSLVVTDYTATD
jgi:hypothetical protein